MSRCSPLCCATAGAQSATARPTTSDQRLIATILSDRELLLRLVPAVARCAGAGRTHEQATPVGKRQVPSIPSQRSILRAKPFDQDLDAIRQRILRDPT